MTIASRYMIHVLGSVKDAYVWCHKTEEQAKEVAASLAAKHGVQVYVAEIIGVFEPMVKWTPAKESES